MLILSATRKPTNFPWKPPSSRPRPLDKLALPDDLDGRNGANRATGRRQIGADDDLDAIRAWLARVASTKTTFENE